MEVDPQSLFDVQVKRIHEYKRQLLNLLYVIVRYQRIIAFPRRAHRTAHRDPCGKAAPGYAVAKAIIKLINGVARVLNADERVRGKLRLCLPP